MTAMSTADARPCHMFEISKEEIRISIFERGTEKRQA
jgi:hypothetical protein